MPIHRGEQNPGFDHELEALHQDFHRGVRAAGDDLECDDPKIAHNQVIVGRGIRLLLSLQNQEVTANR
jgi:hypothetical protein